MTLFTLRAVKKDFGIKEILKDASFSLEEGDKVGLIGTNGSGKSTLAAYIAQAWSAPLIVLDPHHKPSKNPWGNALVIDDKDAIFSAMEYLLTLLDKKDERPLMVMVDEVPTLRLPVNMFPK